MEKNIEVQLTPKELAQEVWNLGSDEHAEMLEEIFKLSDGSHRLMLQGLAVRDDCEKRSHAALEAFQYLFASAFKYMSV